MSEQNDQPPPPEKTESGGDTATKQEDRAPQLTEPQEGTVEAAQPTETAQTKGGTESTDNQTAPTLTEPQTETQPKAETAPETETQATESAATEATAAKETTDAETAPEARETQSEGGEQQPFSPDLERHVFEGETRDNGRLVGYHHREGGEDHGDAKVVEGTKGEPDENGVYEANWTTDDSSREKYSTFFPDDYSQDDVRGAIREAWGNQEDTGVDNQWRGVTSDGITVEGYVKAGKSVEDSTEDDITTAYPLLKPR